MANTLTKQGVWVASGQTATWVPGTSGNPAYCINVQTTSPGGYYKYDPGNPQTNRPAGFFWVNTGPVTTTTQQCYPATSGTQGYYTYTQNYTLSYSLGWTGSAYSVGSLPADGMYQFSVPQGVVGVVSGLNDINVGSGYTEMEHSLYFTSGTFVVLENGTAATTARAYTTADVFTIARLGAQIAYYQGTTLRYISTRPSSGIAVADASLYAAGDQIVNASLSTTVTPTYATTNSVSPTDGPALNNSTTGTLNGLTGFSTNDGFVDTGFVDSADNGPSLANPVSSTTGDWVGRQGGYLRGLVGVISANYGGDFNTGSVTGVLSGLVSQIYGGGGLGGANYNTTSGILTGLTAGGAGTGAGAIEGGLLQPAFRIVTGVLQGLTGFSTALGGTSGGVTGDLRELVGFAADSDGAYITPGVPPGGQGGTIDQTTGDWLGRAGGQLRGLVGEAYDSTAAIDSFINVTLQDRYTFLAYGHVGYGITNGFQGILSGYEFIALGSGITKGILPTLTMSATGTVTLLGSASGTLPTLTMTATGTVTGIASFQGVHSGKYPFEAHGSGLAVLNFPRPTLTARGTVYFSGGVVVAHAGAYPFEAHGSGIATLTHAGDYALTAYGGGVAAEDLPTALLSATGRVALLAQASGVLPRLTIQATGQVLGFGRVAGTLSGLRLRAPGVMVATFPAAVLVATAEEVVTVEYEAYSITLLPGDKDETATSHYTTFPFDRFVRFHDKHYGVAADGLYELGGDTFDGAPIAAVVRTAQTDFKTSGLKRPLSLYLTGRLPARTRVSVTTSDIGANTYSYTARQVADGNQRAIFGRGIESRYLSYGITNPSGADFELDEMMPEIESLRRKA